MKRDRYGIYFSTYFTGPTGREIQAAGRDAVILGVYLGVNEHATMIGLYELPMLYLDHDLPVLQSRTHVRRAFQALAALPSGPFALYDEGTAHVWIPTMARIRLNLGTGCRLAPRDNRSRAAAALYEDLAPNPFLGEFFDRYGDALQLPRRRASVPAIAPHFQRAFDLEDAPSKGLASGAPRGLEGPSKPVIRDQYVQDQGSEIRRPVETVETVENQRDVKRAQANDRD
jgi:hypothetical protein